MNQRQKKRHKERVKYSQEQRREFRLENPRIAAALDKQDGEKSDIKRSIRETIRANRKKREGLRRIRKLVALGILKKNRGEELEKKIREREVWR